MPLACAARKPGCLPNRAFSASTSSSATSLSSARASPGPIRAEAASAFRTSRLPGGRDMGCSVAGDGKPDGSHRHHDLADLLVRLQVAVRLDDLVERERLRDDRLE